MWLYQDAGHGGHETYATTWMDKLLVGDGFLANGQGAGQPRCATRAGCTGPTLGPCSQTYPRLKIWCFLHEPDCLTFPQASCLIQNLTEGKSSRPPLQMVQKAKEPVGRFPTATDSPVKIYSQFIQHHFTHPARSWAMRLTPKCLPRNSWKRV